ncbi:unnamed protein product [Caenorhabditis auriculariae]|uniref:Mediator of RNA polymerase II transcription subunit 14 n=1 Tax=Caenorhabditis auriculariae TaxID=2777116 RepID=A0A8S1HRL0_9PELO|nr:unnamed protein product [Caenorhabditis auriculariae]
MISDSPQFSDLFLSLTGKLYRRSPSQQSSPASTSQSPPVASGADEDDASKDSEDILRPPLPEVPPGEGPDIVPLSVLLDFAVQNIYHEITVLSELMQKKSDADKKISLVQFAHTTRLMFIKLLALVKWLKSSKKFDACNSICYVLESQAKLYVETADRMVAMTRGDLQLARLPHFQIMPAVEVLTKGTYDTLPISIKETFIPPAKISARDQANVLARLNQVIESRISRISSTLSPRYRSIIIRNGTAVLTVPGEFEVIVGVLGETEQLKWTLMNIKMLVEDYEIGYGMQLVHPLQLGYIHSHLQSRMNVSKNPINEIYSFLHRFALSLQLDVLSCQASQLAAGQLRDNIVIEKYEEKERNLVIGYWLQNVTNRRTTLGVPKAVPQYRVQIFADKEDPQGGLKVRHFPHAPHLGTLDTRTGRLSIHRLLSETYIVRCREKLLRLRRILDNADPTLQIQLTGCAVPSLTIPLINDSEIVREECLVVSVNAFTGKIISKNQHVARFPADFSC